ncbi:MAG: phage major capsid protein [Lachnospiraceae bacterium]|nr:phage major capsid protein [Lachnospiraceae bacterium]
MALKVLLTRKRLDDTKKKLEELRAKDVDFVTREAELEASISEAESEDDKAAVESLVEEFETEKAAHEQEKVDLEEEVAKLEEELRAAEEQQKDAVKPAPVVNEERGGNSNMKTRTKFFGKTIEERDVFFKNQEVVDFLERTRTIGREKRSVSGAEIGIPEIMLEVVREIVPTTSKLYKHVFVKSVKGKARKTISGKVPEGVWTEMIAKLNELNLSFYEIEVDGYKVGGFIPIDNSLLEDSDINLATEIITALGQAIGLALDKAILYGTGTKMPLGIVTRLAQTEAPEGYSKTARTWVNLSETNLVNAEGKTELALFKSIIEKSAAANGDYSTGEMFWAMNNKTKTKLVANALSINAAGAIVSGQDNTMPVIGGAIETLNFIPEDVIIGGYGDLYALIEREGAQMSTSEHVRFIEDQTVFKGTARYDGVPVIPEAFVAIGLGNVSPKASDVTFTVDEANKTV